MNEAKKMAALLKPDTTTEASIDSNPVGTGQLTLMHAKAESRIDTRLLARHLGTSHKAVFQLLTIHKDDFLQLGKVPFQMEALQSGQRARANLPRQSLLIVAQMMAAQALQSSPDCRVGYARAKVAVAPLLALTGNRLEINQ